MAAGGVKQAKSNPKFLHSNSTSHVWIFSAFAEIIDNAYDVQAKSLDIDVIIDRHLRAVTFTDNGLGMNDEQLFKMLSFGYCAKEDNYMLKPIGQYGNGFKSGSMRIGKDAIVFTKEVETMSCGLLSQTYLEAIDADTIYLPIVTWDKKTKKLLCNSEQSLEIIMSMSPFESEEQLFEQFAAINSRNGTRIMIYNLSRNSDGKWELDLDSCPDDIIYDSQEVMGSEPRYRYSLREYCSVLFLHPRMQISLRKKRIEITLITKTLTRRRQMDYKPRKANVINIKPIIITLGFSPNNEYGVMMYHKNRLIKGYVKVGYQKQKSSARDPAIASIAERVVGVVEVDTCYLQPIHNKQDFQETAEYTSFINVLGSKLNLYCDTMINISDASCASDSLSTWVMCDECNKWRRLPNDVEKPSDEQRWTCSMNPDDSYNKCVHPQEDIADEDEIQTQLAAFKQERMSVKRDVQRNNMTPPARKKLCTRRMSYDDRNIITAMAVPTPGRQSITLDVSSVIPSTSHSPVLGHQIADHDRYVGRMNLSGNVVDITAMALATPGGQSIPLDVSSIVPSTSHSPVLGRHLADQSQSPFSVDSDGTEAIYPDDDQKPDADFPDQFDGNVPDIDIPRDITPPVVMPVCNGGQHEPTNQVILSALAPVLPIFPQATSVKAVVPVSVAPERVTHLANDQLIADAPVGGVVVVTPKMEEPSRDGSSDGHERLTSQQTNNRPCRPNVCEVSSVNLTQVSSRKSLESALPIQPVLATEAATSDDFKVDLETIDSASVIEIKPEADDDNNNNYLRAANDDRDVIRNLRQNVLELLIIMLPDLDRNLFSLTDTSIDDMLSKVIKDNR